MDFVAAFSAEVNGKRRGVILFDGFSEDDDVDDIETIIMNTEPLYWTFYEDASDEDFDAELTDRSLHFYNKERFESHV